MRTANDEMRQVRAATRAHYEQYPFIEGGQRRIGLWRSRMAEFLPDALIRGARVLDVGASVGEVARSLADRGARVTCIDLTATATRRCRALHQTINVIQADALALPFRNASFDHSVAIGVLHHTPDCARGLREMTRVTRPGGTLTVLLYNRWTPYHALYTMTACIRRRWTADAVDGLPGWIKAVIRLGLRMQTGLRLNDELMKRLIADQVWTPQATFHTRHEVERWAGEIGLRLLKRKAIPFYSTIFMFVRDGAR